MLVSIEPTVTLASPEALDRIAAALRSDTIVAVYPWQRTAKRYEALSTFFVLASAMTTGAFTVFGRAPKPARVPTGWCAMKGDRVRKAASVRRRSHRRRAPLPERRTRARRRLDHSHLASARRAPARAALHDRVLLRRGRRPRAADRRSEPGRTSAGTPPSSSPSACACAKSASSRVSRPRSTPSPSRSSSSSLRLVQATQRPRPRRPSPRLAAVFMNWRALIPETGSGRPSPQVRGRNTASR